MSEHVAELLDAFKTVIHRFEPVRERRKIYGMAMPLGVGEQPPSRLMVFPLGQPPPNDDRKWRFTADDLTAAVKEFKTRTEPLPILYDHGKGHNGEAAGWVDSVELLTDGLYANVHWTDDARAAIRSGKWGFRSPAWSGDEDAEGFIHAGPLDEISLVNKPAIGGMSPNTASSQPSTDTTPPEKENNMANVEAAKKTAAMDMAGVLEAVRAKYPGTSEVFADDNALWAYLMSLQSGDAPADPMMPGASAPAVPLASVASAEDEAKVAAATAAATEKELNAAKEQIASLAASVKALEARELTGRVITASAADRQPGAAVVPDAPSPGDHVGQHLAAYDQRNAATHQAAIAYREKARVAGQKISYYDSVVAVSRRKTA